MYVKAKNVCLCVLMTLNIVQLKVSYFLSFLLYYLYMLKLIENRKKKFYYNLFYLKYKKNILFYYNGYFLSLNCNVTN